MVTHSGYFARKMYGLAILAVASCKDQRVSDWIVQVPSEGIETIKCLSRIFCRLCAKG